MRGTSEAEIEILVEADLIELLSVLLALVVCTRLLLQCLI